ncbi:MAG: LytTR family DNA-binding domain-containing protein [Pseudomonadota bacterium]
MSETPEQVADQLRPQAPRARRILIDLAIMTVIGLFLGFIGPFGSINQPLTLRLVSWLMFAYIGYVVYAPMNVVVDWAERALALPRWGLWVAACLVATVPMTAAVWTIGGLPPPVRMPTMDEALTSYFYVLLIGGGVVALFNAIAVNQGRTVPAPPSRKPSGAPADAGQPAPAPAPAQTAKPSQPRLIERLPAALGSDVLALEMEDHYVRVHTALGSELLLMRLRDAIAELDDADGRQVHRSWWVARGAVEDVVRDGRNVRLKLPREIEAPVSRAQVSELKDAGWF